MTIQDVFSARRTLETNSGPVTFYNVNALEEQGIGQISRMPFSIKVMLESLLRNVNGYDVREEDVRALAGWQPEPGEITVPLRLARVILQDFTGVPAVVDLAALRSAMARAGADPSVINPVVPVDLVIDHSVQVDFFGTAYALAGNVEKEYERKRRALQAPQVGARLHRQLPCRAARRRHRPPGQPRIPGQRCDDARAGRGKGCIPGLACGHGLPHHDDQRTRHSWLGRRRHRGRGRHARPAVLHACAACRWFQVVRQVCRRARRQPTSCSLSRKCCARMASWGHSWSSTAPA